MLRRLVIPCFFLPLAFSGCENAEQHGAGAPAVQRAADQPSDILRATDDDFEGKTAEGIVLVDFYADWCGPCKMMEPYLEDFATEMKEQVKTVKLNVDHSPKITKKYDIQAMPTLLVFVDGKPVKNHVGAFRDKAEIRNFVADVLIEHGGEK